MKLVLQLLRQIVHALCLVGPERYMYYGLLKFSEIVDAQRYCQQMISLNHALMENRAECDKRHAKVIFDIRLIVFPHALSTRMTVG